MAKFKNWKEYIDGRGKLVEKPVVDAVADYKGPDPKSPEQAIIKGKKWQIEAPKSKGKPSPYSGPGKDEGPVNLSKGEKGFGDMGEKELEYTPDTDVPDDRAGEGGKKVETWPKTKTEQFIEKTKDMSCQEFAQYMVEECSCGAIDESDELPKVTAYTAGKFHPYPPEVIKYIVALAGKNRRIMEHLLHEMKREGIMFKLMDGVFDMPESYDMLAYLFGDENGEKRARSLARSMDIGYNHFVEEHKKLTETVGPPFGDGSGGDNDDMSGEDGPDQISGVDGDEEEIDHEGQSCDEAHPDMEHDEWVQQEKDKKKHGEGDGGEGGDDMGQSGPNMTGPGDMGGPRESFRINKKFAEDNLLESMSGNQRMLGKMKTFFTENEKL